MLLWGEGSLLEPPASKLCLFMRFHTLDPQRRAPTPLFSKCSALFPMQRRGSGSNESLQVSLELSALPPCIQVQSSAGTPGFSTNHEFTSQTCALQICPFIFNHFQDAP